MPTLFLVRGLPGSGKSTYAKNLAALDKVWVESDMYFLDACGEYRFVPSQLKNAHKWCQEFVEGCNMRNKKLHIVVSNTFTQAWEMEPYVKMAVEHGYKIKIIHMKTEYKSIHNVPPETMEKMKQRFTINDSLDFPDVDQDYLEANLILAEVYFEKEFEGVVELSTNYRRNTMKDDFIDLFDTWKGAK